MKTQAFDYVIVGAGTAGLVLAGRLSENPEITIAVIEAGGNADADPRVAIPAFFASTASSELDWGYGGAPQPALDGRRIGLAQGKLLGGSSSINAQAFIPFSKSDINSWEELGNKGWNWTSLKPYLERAFNISLPDQETIEHLSIEWAKPMQETYHGPVNVSFADVKENPVGKAWVDTFKNLGFPLTENPFEGKSIGAYNAAATMNASTKARSSASSAHYKTLTERANVKVFLDTTVEKILFDASLSEPRAVGVNAICNETKSTVHAKREVILSSGVFNTPKLLELSGIGNSDLLISLGIGLVVASPNVGNNLQDHVLCSITLEAQDGIRTGDDLARGDPIALQTAMDMYQKHQRGPLTSAGITSFGYLPTPDFKSDPKLLDQVLTSLEEDTTVASPLGTARRDHLKTILKDGDEGTSQYFLFMVQAGLAGKDTTGPFELDPQPGNYITLVSALSHPLSSGSSHIVSANVNEPPMIDHQYLSHPMDLELHARHVRYLDTIASTEPFASLLKPNGRRKNAEGYIEGDLEKTKEYVRTMSTTNHHSCGTCAMAPREKGGVVDENLRVYGVSGLRIVDASVFPFIPQSNLQTLVYTVAERASDMIKESI